MAMQEKKNQETNNRPKLEERFIMNLKGKDFVLYAGLLDLAHQKGIQGITVDAIQYPSQDNGFFAICKATVESKDGEMFVELGDANPRNVNTMIVNHILRMAATRAKARALRDYVNVGFACIDELGPDDVIGDEKPTNGNGKKSEPAKPESGNGGNGKQTAASANGNGKQSPPPSLNGNGNGKKTSTRAATKEEPTNDGKRDAGPKPSTAQIKAIENLARRRNISSAELEAMVQQNFGSSLENITSTEASSFIRTLQQSA